LTICGWGFSLIRHLGSMNSSRQRCDDSVVVVDNSSPSLGVKAGSTGLDS
jgi:hypothetical protein